MSDRFEGEQLGGNQHNVVNPYFGKILGHFMLTLLVSTIMMVVGKMFLPPVAAFGCSFLAIVLMIFVLIKRSKKGKSTQQGITLPFWFVYATAALLGTGMYPIIDRYVSAGKGDIVLLAFGVTVVIFAVLTCIALFTNINFGRLGGILFVALLALIVVSIANLFMGLAVLNLVLAYIGVVVFSGYILFDTWRLKNIPFEKADVPGAVLDMYLNFFNLFLDILRILGYSRD